jgi:hypothetical protein
LDLTHLFWSDCFDAPLVRHFFQHSGLIGAHLTPAELKVRTEFLELL